MRTVLRICQKCGTEIPVDAPEGGCPGCLLETARDAVDGQIVFGRYTLVKVLGRGGMGIVWLARDQELERDVALKFLPDLMIQDRALLDQLKRETKRCLELTHPHIVRIHDFVHDERSGCISMEYVDGETLSNLCAEKEHHVFEPQEVANWVAQLCGALDYAHNRAKVVHRDLKPANLIVNQRGELKIADFGIARSLADPASRLTMEQVRSGTLVYMSPQQLNGERCTHLDDIYSLGATIYELLTSKPPFYSGNIDRQICERVAPSMTERRKELDIEPASVPRIWEDTVAACLAKDPSQHPQSAAEVAQRLQLAPAQAGTVGLVSGKRTNKLPLVAVDRHGNGRPSGVLVQTRAEFPQPRCSDANLEPPDVDRRGSWAMQSRRFSGLPLIGILAVIYFIAGKLGLMLASLHASASPVWPPAGIALAGLLLLGYRAWPGIFIGAFLVNVTTAGNVATAFAIATGNTLEALVGAWLVNRFAGGTNVFDRPQGVFKFALAAGISAIISPAFGVTSLGIAGFADWANYGAIWLTWWLGDATGDLVFTPLVLLWSVASKRPRNKKEAAVVGALLLLLVLLSGVIFGGWPAVSTRNYPIVLICGPVVIWAAFRFTQRETATGIFILSAIAVWGTLHGFGPFVRGTENQSLLAVQWWTAVLSITAMALSAGMAERQRVEEELQQQKAAVNSANGTKDHSLAMLLHELRTPLTPVMSTLEPLKTERAQTKEDKSVEPTSDLEFEIAHLLSIDVAGYSKLSNNEQIELLNQLNQIVRSTDCFRSAEASGKLNRVPTGDGMALLFLRSPEEPVRCALEISRALQDHPRIRLRMGIHSGPVNRIRDVNDKTNFAGSGLNVAQRVLDCGDAGHILLSAHVADDLAQYRHWQPCLQDLGECEVKHGLRLHLFNLCKENLGNPQVPEKLRRRGRWKQESDIVRPVSLPRRPRSLLVLALVVAALAMVISSLTFFQRVSLMTRSTALEETASKGAVLIPEKSIAVLPFENRSDDRANAYFADGIQDEILMRLSRIADLKVISRTSTHHYKSAPENLPEIAKQLGVAHILEGSVQKSRDAVRVNVRLIKAANDSHLWADTFDRKLTDIFSVESEVAKTIADQLQSKISPSEKAAIEKAPTADIAAFDLYERAKALWADVTDSLHANEKLLQAAQLLNEAVARDPQFLLAWCLLSRVQGALYWTGHDHTPVRLNLANAAVQTALRLQPESGEAHRALATYYYYGFRDYARARSELAIARRTLPNDAEVFLYAGLIDRREGHWEDSTRNIERALELDPRNLFILQQLALTYQSQHRYTDAARIYDSALRIVPGDPYTRILRAQVKLDWRADIKPFQATLAAVIAENPNAAPDVDVPLYALCERTAAAAARSLANYPRHGVTTEYGVNCPHAYWEGAVARWQGDSTKEQAAFIAARNEVEEILAKQPDFAAAISLSGVIDAGLGRKEEAIEEGRHACELLSISKDAISGTLLAVNLAQIYAWTGEKDRAIEQIAAVERVPNLLSYGLLKLHPHWDSLRGDPRFEKIVASLAPIER